MPDVKVVWLPSDAQVQDDVNPVTLGVYPDWRSAFDAICVEAYGTENVIMHTYDANRRPGGWLRPSDLDDLIERVFVLHDESQFRAFIDTPNTPHQEN